MSDSATLAGSIVETTHGKIRGKTENGVHVFKGVRYGAPPTGPLRFMPPQKPQPWGGVLDAFDYGPQSPQPASTAERAVDTRPHKERAPGAPRLPNVQRTFQPLPPTETDEDCLFLNVWTPGLNDGRKRPVLVWCHGGGFTSGSGSWIWYDGANMAQRGDAVVVTTNHRLGAVGYMYLKEIGGEKYAASGNAGMLDIVQALEWVRDNIEAFGGDPDCVTVFGQSGGGGKVCNLLAMPAAKGLFHRAIVQSGPVRQGGDPAQATAGARAMLDVLGVSEDDLDALHDIPWQKLVAAQTDPKVLTGPLRGFSPVLDGEILPTHPFDPVATPLAADIPMMVGYTAYEAIFSIGMADRTTFVLDEDGMRQRLGAMLRDKADEAIAAYRKADPTLTPSDVFFRIVSDQGFGMGTVKLAETKHAQGRGPVYFYKFTWDCPVDDGAYRSAHTFEVPFVFHNTEHTPAVTPDSPGVRALSDLMCDAWLAFARTGDPNHPGMESWPAYDPATRATMLFDVASRVENDPDQIVREWWQASGKLR